MSVERGGGKGAAEVRPIYRKGDRVLVKLLTGFCAFVIRQGRGVMVLRGELLLDDVLPVNEYRRSPRRGRGFELV